MAQTDPDPLDSLRDQIRLTQEAAERLAGEASRARQAETPPKGWSTTEEHSARTEEVRALTVLLETIRELIPPELVDQFRDLVRQVLLLLRALIDWWVDRMEQAPASKSAGPPVVQDIPIA